jgi:hypothetical protein
MLDDIARPTSARVEWHSHLKQDIRMIRQRWRWIISSQYWLLQRVGVVLRSRVFTHSPHDIVKSTISTLVDDFIRAMRERRLYGTVL